MYVIDFLSQVSWFWTHTLSQCVNFYLTPPTRGRINLCTHFQFNDRKLSVLPSSTTYRFSWDNYWSFLISECCDTCRDSYLPRIVSREQVKRFYVFTYTTRFKVPHDLDLDCQVLKFDGILAIHEPVQL